MKLGRRTRSMLTVIALAVIAGAVLWNLLKPEEAPAFIASDDELAVAFLDVGQGDALLARCGGQTLLVDAGDNDTAQALVDELKTMGVTRIDLLVGTHPHADHIGGLDLVIETFDIGAVWMPDVTSNTRSFEDVLDALDAKGHSVTVPAPGTTAALGPALVRALGPVKDYGDDLNDWSMVVKLTFGQTSYLLTGDAERIAEQDILDSGADLRATVLKVGHHGSRTSTSKAFLQAVSPRYAVISCGAGNSYGHPHKETLETLQKQGVTVYRTDLSGTITSVSDGVNITFFEER